MGLGLKGYIFGQVFACMLFMILVGMKFYFWRYQAQGDKYKKDGPIVI